MNLISRISFSLTKSCSRATATCQPNEPINCSIHSIISGFLRVFLNKRDDFTLSGSGPFSERELIPKVESLEEIMERLRKGDQDVEFTADQMRAYFRNLKKQ